MVEFLTGCLFYLMKWLEVLMLEDQNKCYKITREVLKKGFNLILLRDVLEHFYDPIQELKDINKILSKNGCVYIETVNIDDPDFSKSPTTWCHSKPFEHPYLFSKTHVDCILKESGFEVVENFKVVQNRYHLLARKSKKDSREQKCFEIQLLKLNPE